MLSQGARILPREVAAARGVASEDYVGERRIAIVTEGWERAHPGPVSADNDIRESLARSLPGAVQPFLTWLMAKPADAETRRAQTPAYHVWTAFLWLTAGVAGSILILSVGGWWFAVLPITLIVTTSGLGKLQAVVYHHCAHETVFRSHAANTWMGEFISILLLIGRFADYRRDHLRHHFVKVLLTDEDEFLQFLRDRLGMRPGMPKRVLRRKMLASLFSPAFYAKSLLARARGCFLSGSPTVNAAAAATWAAALAAVAYYGVWWEFAVVWLVPVVVLYQAATMFRVLCEHRFPAPDRFAVRNARFICESTVGVIAGTPPPPAARGFAGFAAWAGWWAEMLTVHLFCRVLVLVGDAPAHDYHHRNPGSRKWANHIVERHRAARSGCAEYPINYLEHWGLFQAVDDVLETLSRMPAQRG